MHRTENSSTAQSLPLLKPLQLQLSAEQAFLRLCHLPHIVWFDSAGGPESLARFSFITADPWQTFSAVDEVDDPLGQLEPMTRFLEQQTNQTHLPFVGGLAGVLSYDLCRSLEAVPDHGDVDLPMPLMCVGCYDWAIVFDHLTEQKWIVSQGWPEMEWSTRLKRAERRLQEIEDCLKSSPRYGHRPTSMSTLAHIAPQYQTQLDGVTSNFSSSAYREAIGAIVDYIRAGDVFQVNLAQRLLIADSRPSVEHYLRLRKSNRAPLAGYFDGGDWQVLSSSPERLIQRRGVEVETRPIKGTCRRTGDTVVDELLARELLHSVKDRAENIMIVDLMRNDLSRVCQDNSVRVSRVCELEPYARVQHLVSVVTGRLNSGLTTIDLLRATFPGGSVTGAPKLRAMQIIAELEPTRRSFYCGSLGYVSSGGRSDFSILIRSILATDGYLQVPVGGGITARSDPYAEEQETWDKASAILAAFESK